MSVELAAAAVAFIAPYLTEAGKEAAKTAGKETAGAGLRLLSWMRDKLTGRAKEASAELEEKPDSQLNQDDLRTQLAKSLEKQPELVPQMRELLSEARAQGDVMSQNVGAGGKASQIKGNQNRVSIREGSGPTFNAGRDNKGAFATGDFARATATLSETTAPDANVNISAALAALREVLAGVPGIEAKALTRLDEARDEAAKPKPKRDEVKNLVAQATRYARDAAGFAEASEKLKPHLQQVAAWLGSTWQSWAPALGLA
jgi:hypothetical protein